MADQGNVSHGTPSQRVRAAALRLEIMSVSAWQACAPMLAADALAILVGETLCGDRDSQAWIIDPVFAISHARMAAELKSGKPVAWLLQQSAQKVVVLQADVAAGHLVAALQCIRRDRVYVPPGIWLGLCRLALQPPRHRQPHQIEALGRLLEGWIGGLLRLQRVTPCVPLDPVRQRELTAWRALIWSSVCSGESLGTVMRAAGTSLTQAQRILRAGLGISPSRYRMELRLRTAAARILADSGRCDMLAADLAYASPSQFSADYRRLFGVPPTRTWALLDELGSRSDAATIDRRGLATVGGAEAKVELS